MWYESFCIYRYSFEILWLRYFYTFVQPLQNIGLFDSFCFNLFSLLNFTKLSQTILNIWNPGRPMRIFTYLKENAIFQAGESGVPWTPALFARCIIPQKKFLLWIYKLVILEMTLQLNWWLLWSTALWNRFPTYFTTS